MPRNEERFHLEVAVAVTNGKERKLHTVEVFVEPPELQPYPTTALAGAAINKAFVQLGAALDWRPGMMVTILSVTDKGE